MSRKGIVLFASMCVIWGIPYLMIRVAVRELTPATLVFWRTALAALLLMPLAILRGHIRPLLAHWKAFVAYTVIEVAIPWLFLARAEIRISSSLAGLLIAAVPLVGATVVTVTGDHEWKGGRRLAGLAVGMVGVAAIVGVDVHSTGVVPILEMAIVAVCYGTGPLILSRWLSDAPALGVVAASLALTALIYVPLAVVQWPGSTPSAHVVESVLGLALICTAVAFLVFFALIAEVGPVRATVITYVNPAVAAIVGVAVLGEHVTVGMILGFLLVLAGAFLATGGPTPHPEHRLNRRRATLER
jgi:drug/metabolite transporter (DMT)-like permease